MLHINFTDEEIQTLHFERYHYPDPKIQKKFEVLWLKSQHLSHESIAQLSGVCSRTVQRYLHEYLDGGTERLKQNHYSGAPSELNAHTETLKDYFTKHPPSTAAHAQKAIEDLTGLHRSLTQVREFLKRLGMKRRKVGSAPGKADDPDKQQEQREFVATQLNPRLDEAERGQRKIFLSTPAILSLVLFCAICGALRDSSCARLRGENGTMFWGPWITSPNS
jgi:transposase